jgi:hypothetical protein
MSIKALFKRANLFSITPREVQTMVEKTGQAASYVAGNQTEAIQVLTNGIVDTSKGIVTTHSGTRAGVSIFKGVKDYFRGDLICTGLCSNSLICETTAGIIIWMPIPGKICAVSGLKGVSYGCMKIRDMCAAEPNNPLC